MKEIPTKPDARQTNLERFNLNAMIIAGVDAKKYFPGEETEVLDQKKVKLKITKGLFQTLLVTNLSVINSAYGKYREKVFPSAQAAVSEDEWNNFLDSQLSTSTELGKVTAHAIFEVNHPSKPDDWMSLSEQETEIEVSFKTAKSLTQLLMAVVHVGDFESRSLETGNKEYFEYIVRRDKELRGAESILSQLAEQGFLINTLQIERLREDISSFAPHAEGAKSLLETRFAGRSI